MSKDLSPLTTSTVPPDGQRGTTQRTLRNILFIVIVTTSLLSFVDGILFNRPNILFALGPLAIASIVSLYYLQRQILWPAQVIIPAGTLIAVTYLMFVGNGVHDLAIIGFGLVLMLAGLTLGGRALILFGLLSALAVTIIGILEMNGFIADSYSIEVSDIAIISIATIAGAFLLRLLLGQLEHVIRELQQSEQEQVRANTELIGLKDSLEKRVADRTHDLETRTFDLEVANKQVATRASQFEALAQVTQAITSIRNLDELLPRIASVISERFGFYHVGVFLLDEVNEYAILSATNSEGGRRMLERNHRLRVGEQGIVGNVTQTGSPRVAMDVGDDAVFFDNPELPETHSEMALPLRTNSQIIGALDVQSTERGAFTDEDIQMLGLLANQVSLAIENARLFEETRRALAESEAVGRKIIRDAWQKLPSEQRLLGFRSTPTGSVPLNKPVELPDSDGHKAGVGNAETTQIAVPIELRGEKIGSLIVQSSAADIDQDQLDLIKAVAERVAISAENARLFDETTRRAERERTVAEITGKIRSVNDPQAMIRIAIEELRSALGATRVEIVPQSLQGTQ